MANGTQDLASNIGGNAVAPQTATTDGVTATQQPLPDQIEADRYLASKQVARTPPFGISIAAIVSPGSQSRSVGWPYGAGWGCR